MDIGSLLNQKDSPSPRAASPASQAPSSQLHSEPESVYSTPAHYPRHRHPSNLPSNEVSTSSDHSLPRPTDYIQSRSKSSRLLDISSQALDNISSIREQNQPMASARSGMMGFDVSSAGFVQSDPVDQLDPSEAAEGREFLPKTLPCSGCHKMFARRSDLVRHERIHSGHRPHRCPHAGCDKSFIQRSALTVHERVHTGQKPHTCTECGKPFSDSSSLARHRRTHSGLRPYQCDFQGCGKDFTRRTTLTRHKQQHMTKGHVPVAVPDAQRHSVSPGSSRMEEGSVEQQGGRSPKSDTNAPGPSMYHSFALNERHAKKTRRRQSRASQTSNTRQTTQTPPSLNMELANHYGPEHDRTQGPPPWDDPRYGDRGIGSQSRHPPPQYQHEQPHHPYPPHYSSAPAAQPAQPHPSQTMPPGYPPPYQQSYPGEPSRGPQQPYYSQQSMRPVAPYGQPYSFRNSGS